MRRTRLRAATSPPPICWTRRSRASTGWTRTSTPSSASMPRTRWPVRGRWTATGATVGSAGPLAGVPMAHKDMYYRAGKVSSCGARIRREFRPASDGDRARTPRCGRRHRPGRPRHGRVRHGAPRLQRPPAALPQRLGFRAHPLRLLVGLGHGSRRPAGLRRPRLRHRRLDPLPGGGQRRGRHQPDAGPRQPLRLHADVVVARRDGAASRGRCSDCARVLGVDRGPRTRTTPARAPEPVPDYEATIEQSVRGVRIGVPSRLLRRRPRFRALPQRSRPRMRSSTGLGATLVPVADAGAARYRLRDPPAGDEVRGRRPTICPGSVPTTTTIPTRWASACRRASSSPRPTTSTPCNTVPTRSGSSWIRGVRRLRCAADPGAADADADAGRHGVSGRPRLSQHGGRADPQHARG